MKEFFKNRSFKYIVIFIVLIIFYGAMISKPAITMMFGQEVLIKTRAYDPRDVFRGDYIQLFYDINEISFDKMDKEMIKLLEENAYGYHDKEIFVILAQHGKYFDVEEVTLSKPEDKLYIKGRISYITLNGNDKVNTIVVEYSLDKYFVPENTGKELEDKVMKGEAFALIKVFKGYALLLDVIAE